MQMSTHDRWIYLIVVVGKVKRRFTEIFRHQWSNNIFLGSFQLHWNDNNGWKIETREFP